MRAEHAPRIFYCGMVNTIAYSSKIEEPLHIGAASNKMISIVRAMRDAGAKAYLVSMPVLGRDAVRRSVPPVLIRDRDGPHIFISIVANPLLRKTQALICFAWFCVSKVGRRDRVLLYNHSLEYLLGAVILSIRGNRAILDIEDSPREDESGWRGFIGRSLFSMINGLSCNRKLIVSESLAKSMRLRQYCVVYGATKMVPAVRDKLQASSCDIGGKNNPLKIHYGGSLSKDTGVDLFCAAVEILIESLNQARFYIHFVVTGFGSDKKIRTLQASCVNSDIRISYFPSLPPDDYLDQFSQCHVALSLKLPESEMAMTTFPSKVVEITSNGLLLISTSASDVPILFGDGNAIVLSDAEPSTLAYAIQKVLDNPQCFQRIAKNGQVRAMELFDSKNVGARIVDFILKKDV